MEEKGKKTYITHLFAMNSCCTWIVVLHNFRIPVPLFSFFIFVKSNTLSSSCLFTGNSYHLLCSKDCCILPLSFFLFWFFFSSFSGSWWMYIMPFIPLMRSALFTRFLSWNRLLYSHHSSAEKNHPDKREQKGIEKLPWCIFKFPFH